MSQSLLHPDNLLAQLIGEFKASPKPAKPLRAKPAQLSTSRAKEIHLATAPQWIPQAVIHHIYEQTCLCCHATSEFIGNTLVRHHNPRLFAYWEFPRSTLANLDHLPREHILHSQTVEACPSCLRAETALCDFPASHPHQQSLFH